jgi:hypothetical protein
MSSLQKFHRRTNNVPSGPVTWPASAIGMGDDTHGYWLAGPSNNKLIVSPISTEFVAKWGASIGIVRGTINTTDGLTNTNTLYSFGSAAHPAANYCKNLTTGGYNTWYLPAKDELVSILSKKTATPFSTLNGMAAGFWSSTEYDSDYCWWVNFNNNTLLGGVGNQKKDNNVIRAVRRSAI